MPVSRKRVRSRLQLHLNLRVGQRFERFLHFPRGWVDCCDRHFSSLLAIPSSSVDSRRPAYCKRVYAPAHQWNGCRCGSTLGAISSILVGPLYLTRFSSNKLTVIPSALYTKSLDTLCSPVLQ